VATRGSGSHLGNFTVGQITQDFVQTEALKFFERLTSELSTPAAHDRSPSAELMILAYTFEPAGMSVEATIPWLALFCMWYFGSTSHGSRRDLPQEGRSHLPALDRGIVEPRRCSLWGL
jgi:hypothetical protein